jgi:2-polyprenyl-3-methyl-5-hydroxy-6-metoxy-1,4-benzoquinol methylase
VKRTITPEILDSLPPEDPAAIDSRRDLRWFNAVLGGRRWFRRMLADHARSGERILEIGAGTGELGGFLAGQGMKIDGLDFGPRPAAWPADRRWHQDDALKFDGWCDYKVVIGNLIFHHFDAPALRALGERMSAHARVIVASEPVRRRRFQILFAALCACIGANHVSRHDGRVSIGAGFIGNELPLLLGLDPKLWRWRTAATFRGAYRMVAERLA